MLRLIPRLGIGNAFRLLGYRILARTGYYRWRLPAGQPYSGPFFVADGGDRRLLGAPGGAGEVADRILAGELPFFGWDWRRIGFPPDWSSTTVQPSAHWSRLDEFAGGDIKDAWEPSRFAGLQLLAHAACCAKTVHYVEACNAWIGSWVEANPFNTGVQWKCAQETALRLLATIVSADLLERHAGIRPTAALMRFIREHARRIQPTLLYAIAQDNNHATSEAAGLFVAGAFLRSHGFVDGESRLWLKTGRRLIEARLRYLVMPDGSFSQHSVTYHRLMLDTVSVAEIWRLRISASPWTSLARERLAKASRWMETVIDPVSGDAPNLGANDGANFFAVGQSPYRDFRASANLAACLFLGRRSVVGGGSQLLELTLGLKVPPPALSPPLEGMEIFQDGGYAVWIFGHARMLLRLPIFRFRPSHCDVLHIDLFWQGVNLLRDGGSFSYNSKPDRSTYFAGVASHNTVQFDGRDQMPRLGRFLWGEWPHGSWSREGESSLSASYTDWKGARHERRLRIKGSVIHVDDFVSGFTSSAVQRWRLPPGELKLSGMQVKGDSCTFDFSGDGDLKIRIVDGQESRCYQATTPVRVVEVERRTPGRISARINLLKEN